MARAPKKTTRTATRGKSENQRTIGLILAIAENEYGHVSPRLAALFKDVAALYGGRWPSHEACAVTYHNFGHALDVCLAAARIFAGWNHKEENQALSVTAFHLGMAAALFHDSGYIKTKGDSTGAGGKFTLVHVERSMEIAGEYLGRKKWLPEEIDAVKKIISATDYNNLPDFPTLFPDPSLEVTARIVATADLVSQMADTDYLKRIDDLFIEFQEVYEFEIEEALNRKGTRIYQTVQEIKDETIAFYEQFILPTLTKLGDMDRYLAVFFGDGRNPYQENISANLSAHLMNAKPQWRRIGVILVDLGLASNEEIAGALARQKMLAKKHHLISSARSFNALIRENLPSWFATNSDSGHSLGDILMEMRAVKPKSLARGLIAQMLPDLSHDSLSSRELHFLLETAILLQNLGKGAWIVEVVLEMANDILACEASSILIVDLEDKEMLVALPSGPQKDLIYGKGVPLDKGLSGWVYRNGQPARVNNVSADARFDRTINPNLDFVTRSILAVPLHINGECIGVIEALNKNDDDFTQNDMQALTILANMVANAMAVEIAKGRDQLGVLCAQPIH